jgi:hypothetical protein
MKEFRYFFSRFFDSQTNWRQRKKPIAMIFPTPVCAPIPPTEKWARDRDRAIEIYCGETTTTPSPKSVYIWKFFRSNKNLFYLKHNNKMRRKIFYFIFVE